ncbi:STM4504/CBY_0614 family protein [Limnobaculum xujianqingii]|uniref:STM4504/CBY_0614 family protein n=1 Tax=Limnobaculum xujianqingii TaxID=2738837 RepID=UPI00112A4FC2|nr:hypothetical protein [Limnobaculum xujianqingii]
MGIFELFSTRKKRLNGELPDVYKYDVLPEPLKVQIVQIVIDTIGLKEEYGRLSSAMMLYEHIHNTLCKEYGVFTLGSNQKNDFSNVYDYFLTERKIDKLLDVIELTFKVIDNFVRLRQNEFTNHLKTKQTADEAINELNHRFKAAGVGYEYTSGEIIRIDSEIIHSTVIKPALALLQGSSHFDGAQNEFLLAHEHYRHKRYKECIADCNKAFESCMKAICHNQGWSYSPKDPAKKLINTCLSNNLVPSYMQAQLNGLANLLESGLPTIRNSNAGHGQGTNVVTVEDDLVAYALHLTASNIVFFAECEKKLP